MFQLRKTTGLFSLTAALVMVAASAGSAQAKNLVTNGDFALQAPYTFATDWVTSGYNFRTNDATAGAKPLWDAGNGGVSTWDGKSTSGGYYAALDGDVAKALTQTITGLTVNQSYKFSFDYAFSQQHGYSGPTTQDLNATIGSSSFTTASYDLANHDFSGWMSYSGTFIANSASEVLTFLAYGNKPVPPYALVTNVVISAVPEPGVWLMILSGVGLIGFVARRRQNFSAAYA